MFHLAVDTASERADWMRVVTEILSIKTAFLQGSDSISNGITIRVDAAAPPATAAVAPPSMSQPPSLPPQPAVLAMPVPRPRGVVPVRTDAVDNMRTDAVDNSMFESTTDAVDNSMFESTSCSFVERDPVPFASLAFPHFAELSVEPGIPLLFRSATALFSSPSSLNP